MVNLAAAARILSAAIVISVAAAAVQAQEAATTLNYAVLRNGERIGSTTVRIQRDGAATTAEVATHVQVKIAYVTVYRFDQYETERLADDRLLALKSVTDDNGSVHNVSATSSGNVLAIDVDGKRSTIDPRLIPVSLWNASLLKQSRALNAQNGKVTPVSVVDRGEEPLMLGGRPTLAHHYSIDTGIAQDVWYDHGDHLVKVEMHAVDGSNIQYKLG